METIRCAPAHVLWHHCNGASWHHAPSNVATLASTCVMRDRPPSRHAGLYHQMPCRTASCAVAMMEALFCRLETNAGVRLQAACTDRAAAATGLRGIHQLAPAADCRSRSGCSVIVGVLQARRSISKVKIPSIQLLKTPRRKCSVSACTELSKLHEPPAAQCVRPASLRSSSREYQPTLEPCTSRMDHAKRPSVSMCTLFTLLQFWIFGWSC